MARSWAFKDETGKTYGRLTVLEFSEKRETPSGQSKTFWRCKCSCGKEAIVNGGKLRNEETQSCGCLRAEAVRARCCLPDGELERRKTEPRKCNKCGETKPADQFGCLARHWCNPCVATWTRNYNKGKHHTRRLKDYYGVTPSIYSDILDSQGGVCAICKQPPKSNRRLAVDHDHGLSKGDKGFIRGLLCSGCNSGIGQFKENVDLIEEAARYLRKSR